MRLYINGWKRHDMRSVEYNDATDADDLRRRQQDVYKTLKDALDIARADLMTPR